MFASTYPIRTPEPLSRRSVALVLSGLLKLAQLAVYSFPFQTNDEFAFGGSCGPSVKAANGA